MTSPLEDELLLLLISIRSSADTLEKLFTAGLWPAMRKFASDEHFWYMRVQQIARRRSPSWQPREWRRVYWNLMLPIADGTKHLGHYDTVRVMLELGYDRARTRSGDLVRASELGNERVLDTLIERGWTNLTPSVISTALSVASREGHTQAVQILLSNYEGVIDSGALNNAAITASQGNHRSTLALLLGLERVDPSTWPDIAINHICAHGFSGALSLLIGTHGLSVATLNSGLRSACYQGRVEVARLLLKCEGVDPRSENDSPLVVAVSSGSLGLVQLLLDEGACPSARCNSIIRDAARSGNIEIVRLLLSYKKVNPSVEKSRAFRDACRYGHLDIAQALLKDKRVKPDANESQALRVAVQWRRVEVVKWLLSLDCVNPLSALDVAGSKTGSAEILDLLLRDRRVDLSSLPLNYLPIWIALVRTYMEDRMVAYMLANTVMGGPAVTLDGILAQISQANTLHISLLQFILVKRPSRLELIDWMIARRESEFTVAARSLLNDESPPLKSWSAESIAYRALLSVLVHDRRGDTILSELREQKCSKEALLISARLIATHLGSKEVSTWRLRG